jgi:hypothetical protein
MRTQAEVILNHVNPNTRRTGQGEAMHKKYNRLKLGGGQAYDGSSTVVSEQLHELKHYLLHNPALT